MTEHPAHRAYVGGPDRFDLLGGRHFMLLHLLGLRERHSLLDFGCGALRSGRLLIPYLDPGGYFGIDPNRWLIDAGLEQELGRDIERVKRPRFDFNGDCDLGVFGVDFDFIHAHSVFTHAPRTMIDTFFGRAREVLRPEGLVVGTYVSGDEDHAGDEWVYPEVIAYTDAGFAALGAAHGFVVRRLRWPHHNQTYFAAAHAAGPIDRALDAVRTDFELELDLP